MTQLGRYQLKSVLGRGAMGLVYEALDPRLDRRVAIKTILKSHLLDDSVAQDYSRRFVREAQAAARLTHPHIVTVYDFGEEDEVAYIVMEFIEGRELAQHFDNQNYFGLPEAVRILCELLDALAYAHDRGIVHRDVKPANVMIDRAGHVKLTDFGVARLVDTGADRTMPGTMVGTPSYMSPEQIQGMAVGSRTDLFAVGVILYQFLTHERPFGGGGQWAVQRKILHEDPLPPSQLAPASPRIFDAIALRALAKNPDHRFQSAGAFASELRLALQTLPGAAAPPPRPEPQSDITVMLTRPRPPAAPPPPGDDRSTLPGARTAPVATAPAPQRLGSTAATAPMTPLDIARAPLSTWLPPRQPVQARGLAPMSGGPTPMPPLPRGEAAATSANPATEAGTATPKPRTRSPYERRQPSRAWLAGLAAVATLPLALMVWRPGQPKPATETPRPAASAVLTPKTTGPVSTPPPAVAPQPVAPRTAIEATRPETPASATVQAVPASTPTTTAATAATAVRMKPASPRLGDSGALRPNHAAETEAGSKVAADRRPAATARGSGARCAELTQRLQLGEALSPEHLEVFQKECKR